VADPVDGEAAIGRLQIQHIETQCASRQLWSHGQKMPRGALYLALLPPVDAGSAAAVVAARAQTHFRDDHNAVRRLRDDVDLAGAAAVVARQNREVLCLQEFRGSDFGSASGFDAVRLARCQGAAWAAGAAG
jgi:hypothetical protein